MIRSATILCTLLFSTSAAFPAALGQARAQRAVYFEPNRGQDSAAAPFLGKTSSQSVRFDAGTIELGELRLRFLNSGGVLAGEDMLPSHSSYYRGSDPARWQRDVPNFARLRERNLYPGIDCVFYGNSNGELEYDLVAAPSARLEQVVFEIEGASRVSVNSAGDLEIAQGDRVLVQKKPRVLQDRREIAASYRVQGMQVSYRLGQFNGALPLVIDPVLEYASYLGGNTREIADAITTDAAGNVYVTGVTQSTNFPPAPVLMGASNGAHPDVYLTKFDATGKNVLFSVVLASTGQNSVYNVAVDGSGNIYLVGQAGGPDFPVVNAYQKSVGNTDQSPNGFVAKFDAAGNPVFSTYLGGKVSPPLGAGTVNTSTGIQTIAFDGKGNVWVGGWTFATDFPCTLGPAPIPASYPYTTLTGFTSTGALVNSMTFSYGYNAPPPNAMIAADSAGNIVLAGTTVGGLAATPGAIQTQAPGAGNIFVARINPTGTASNYILALTYFGGNKIDVPYAVTLDSAGDVYVAGTTTSGNLPVTAGALESTLRGSSGAFLAKLNAALTQVEYLTYLGGSSGTQAVPRGVQLDSTGNIYLTGYTDFTDLTPASLSGNAGALQPAIGGGIDGFVLRLNPSGSQALDFTYFGGSATDYIFGSWLDSALNLYAAGSTNSSNLPVENAYQASLTNTADNAFFLKLAFSNPNVPSITSVNVAGSSNTAIAQNIWIEIHGANLAPAGTSSLWSSAPDFLQGKMPTSLSGVSVTVNGNPAFIYYVSPTQVNVLTPLDNTIGAVKIVLASGSTQTAPFTATMQALSPSFLLFGASTDIAAIHLNGSLLGPTSLSAPGYTFTPAAPSEYIVLYGVGFGLPTSPLSNGSASQSGSLPSLPVIQIGGVTANVIFAGLVSPGLYQFNVQAPPGTPNGNISVIATYGGLTTPAADTIAVQQ